MIQTLGCNGQEITLSTPAKINLFFELQGKREDGFHDIETIMSTVSLFDDIRFTLRTDGILRLTIKQQGCTKQEDIPSDERNLILRAMQMVRQRFGSEDLGCDVLLRKRIPSAAGLGGASGNAAGAILAANKLWKLRLSDDQLCEVGSEIGSDVPFFFRGGTSRCTGRGEIIKALSVPAGMAIVIAKPNAGLSTKAVYGKCLVPSQPKSSTALQQSLQTGHLSGIGQSLFNRLEEFAMSMTPTIGKLKETFDRLNCVGHQMSGSGSSYFGIFQNHADAHRAAKLATRFDGNTVFTCMTMGREGTFRNPVEAGQRRSGWKLQKSESN